MCKVMEILVSEILSNLVHCKYNDYDDWKCRDQSKKNVSEIRATSNFVSTSQSPFNIVM